MTPPRALHHRGKERMGERDHGLAVDAHLLGLALRVELDEPAVGPEPGVVDEQVDLEAPARRPLAETESASVARSQGGRAPLRQARPRALGRVAAAGDEDQVVPTASGGRTLSDPDEAPCDERGLGTRQRSCSPAAGSAVLKSNRRASEEAGACESDHRSPASAGRDPRGAGPRVGGRVPVGPRDTLLSGDPPRARGGQPGPDAVPARPRPDRALEGVPATQAQDAGVHRTRGRSLPDPARTHSRRAGSRAPWLARWG